MNPIGFPSPNKPVLPWGRPGSSQNGIKDNEIPTMSTVKSTIWGPEAEFDAGVSGVGITLDFGAHNAQVLCIDTNNAEIHFTGMQDGRPYTLLLYYTGANTPLFKDVASWRGVTEPAWSSSVPGSEHLVDYLTLYMSKGNVYGAASTGHTPLIPGRVFGFGAGGKWTGDGTVINRTSPVPALLPGIAVEVIRDAALLTTGRVYAWGENPGDNTAITKTSPVAVSLPAGTFTRVMGSILLNCALRNDNTHWFWGRFSPDAVNHTVNVTSPISISLAFTIAQLAGRFSHIALGTDNSIWTWGSNAYKLVANNATATYSVPYNYMAANSTIRQVASGFDTFHYLKTDGTVWSWGRGSEGQLGDGVSYPYMTGVTTPVQASTGVSFVKIATNIYAVMALTAAGEIYVWGYSDATPHTTPTKISTSVSFKDIAGIGSAFFLLDKDNYLYAVGDATYGVAGTYPPERVPGNIKVTRLPYASGNEYVGDPYASAFNFAL